MNNTSLLNSRYQIEERIGTGGMSDVFRARDLMLERTVAVKVLRDDLSSDPTFRERFRHEARSVANLSHPSIVTIHDFGFDNGKLFLVMEYVPGIDLKTILARRGRFKIDEALPLLIQACAGLGYAHRSGLIHCDVKPHNLIVTPESQLKIADFGIARALSTIQPHPQPNVVWGSPQYFSPEQAAGQVLTPASDVYSLGIVMYEMLTGRLPFNANTASELSILHRTTPPPPPHQWNPQITPEIEAVILKVLSKEPAARYRNADQFGLVLMSSNHPSPATPAPVLSRPAPNAPRASPLDIDWVSWALALLALIAVGGLIPLWLWVYLLYFPTVP